MLVRFDGKQLKKNENMASPVRDSNHKQRASLNIRRCLVLCMKNRLRIDGAGDAEVSVAAYTHALPSGRQLFL